MEHDFVETTTSEADMLYMRNDAGDNAVHLAVKSNQANILRLLLLLDLGEDEYDDAAVAVAVAVAASVEHDEDCSSSANRDRPPPNNSNNNNNNNNHLQTNSATTLFLVHATDKFGGTALHAAACQRNEEMVQILLERGASPTCTNSVGDTALHYATQRGHVEVIRLLLHLQYNPNKNKIPKKENGDDDDDDDDDIRGGAIATASRKFLCEQPNAEGDTALHIAAMHGQSKALTVLLAEQPPIAAARRTNTGNNSTSTSTSTGGARVAFFINPNVPNPLSAGDTPLHKAVCAGQHDAVRVLLQHGATVNTPNTKGVTALHYCCSAQDSSSRSIFPSTKKTSDVENDHQDTTTTSTVTWSISNEGSVSMSFRRNDTHLAHLLLQHGANEHAKDKGGRTPMQYAAKRGKDGIVRLLIGKASGRSGSGGRGGSGISELINEQDNYGYTPLRLASMRRHRSNRNADVVRLLMSYGAS